MYRDPDTGRIGAPPPGAAVEAPPAAGEQLQSQAAAAPSAEIQSDRHGLKINLRGRFRAAVRRTAGSAGVQHQCTEDEAAVHE
jgi:hypothetical protein